MTTAYIPNFILKDTTTANGYTVNLYHIENEDIVMESVANAIAELQPDDMPNKIVDKLSLINGVSKIEIYDNNNTLLINSEKIIEL